MTDLVLSKIENHTLILTLNRPDKRNALTFAMYQKLADEFNTVNDNPDIRCVLLQGSGGHFTGGNDLMDFMQLSQGLKAFDKELEVSQMMRAILTLTKPLVVAVEGSAIGIGTTLLFHADVVVTTPDANMNLAFTSLGLAPEFASSKRMAEMIGLNRTRHMLMLSESFDGQTAYDLGIATAVASAEDLEVTALNFCKKLVNLPAASLRNTKALLKKGSGHDDIEAMLEAESEVWAVAVKSPEFMEAAMAFMQKRKPDFLQFD